MSNSNNQQIWIELGNLPPTRNHQAWYGRIPTLPEAFIVLAKPQPDGTLKLALKVDTGSNSFQTTPQAAPPQQVPQRQAVPQPIPVPQQATPQPQHHSPAQLTQNGQCKSCNAPISWGKTDGGKNHPYNLNGTSHFETCPNAKQHRKSPYQPQQVQPQQFPQPQPQFDQEETQWIEGNSPYQGGF